MVLALGPRAFDLVLVRRSVAVSYGSPGAFYTPGRSAQPCILFFALLSGRVSTTWPARPNRLLHHFSGPDWLALLFPPLLVLFWPFLLWAQSALAGRCWPRCLRTGRGAGVCLPGFALASVKRWAPSHCFACVSSISGSESIYRCPRITFALCSWLFFFFFFFF